MIYAEGANPNIAFDRNWEGEGQGWGFDRVMNIPLPREAAQTFAARLEDSSERCIGAIPVAPDSAFRSGRKTLYVNATANDGEIDPMELARIAMPSKTVVDAEVVEDKRRTRVESHRAKKKVTEWAIIDASGTELGRDVSVAKALKLAKQFAGRDHPAGLVPVYHVRGIIGGDGSPNYATYRQVQTYRKVKLKVRFVETTRKDPAPIGWVFFRHAG